MQTEVIVPELGMQAGQPITLSVWFADSGDFVYEGDRLVELLVGGATFDISSPATGRLSEILAHPDDVLQTGQVLGFVETDKQVGDENQGEIE
jgi:pyruvate/2-oxoglutarate dehydrogenase complex dihydrolipoamide acyltransferase (E2) component